MAKNATASRAHIEMPQTDNADFSRRERRMWGLSLDSWNTLMVVFLSVGAAAAAVVGVATFITIRLQKQEAIDAQLSLDRYKVTVQGQVADAHKEGVAAGKAAGDAILKAAQASERAAALEAEAAKLKLELARIKSPLLERHISAEQQIILTRDLSGRRFQVGIIAPSPDREINKYALELISSMEKAGVRVFLRFIAGSIRNEGINAVPDGINIVGDEPAVSAFRKGFENAAIPFGMQPLDVSLFKIPGAVFISVGNRPSLAK